MQKGTRKNAESDHETHTLTAHIELADLTCPGNSIFSKLIIDKIVTCISSVKSPIQLPLGGGSPITILPTHHYQIRPEI